MLYGDRDVLTCRVDVAWDSAVRALGGTDASADGAADLSERANDRRITAVVQSDGDNDARDDGPHSPASRRARVTAPTVPADGEDVLRGERNVSPDAA